jgi:C-5 cytosine-specific DNA methylase
MRMLDLFCGRFGWSRAFAARGWECVGVDLVAPPEIPDGCTFAQRDILEMTADDIRGFDFVCASSPCEQFSVHGLKCFHPNPPYPEIGMRLFNHTRAICEAAGVPYLMENVRSAQAFVGMSAHKCGPFHLWGNSVPTLMPQGISKGTKFGLDRDGTRNGRKIHDMYYRTGSNSKGRREQTAIVATIPPELAACVADYAEAIMGCCNAK